MFKNMKPLPKAILIGIVVAVPIWAITKFLPDETVASQKATVEVQVQEVPKVEVPKVVEVETEAPRSNVTSGAAGMDAVLKAGKK